MSTILIFITAFLLGAAAQYAIRRKPPKAVSARPPKRETEQTSKEWKNFLSYDGTRQE